MRLTFKSIKKYKQSFFNWMKKLANIAKNKLLTLIRFSIFYIVTFLLRTYNYLLLIVIFPVIQKKLQILSIIYILFLLLVSRLVFIYQSYILEDSDYLAFFTATGALLSSVTAIIFSFSVLLIQHASQSLPASFYKLAVKLTLQDIVYFTVNLIVIVFLFFSTKSAKSTFIPDNLTLPIAFFLIGLSFYLIYTLFYRVRDKLNPSNIADSIKNDQLSYLRKIDKRARWRSKLLKFLSEIKGGEKQLESLYLATAYQAMTINFDYLNIRLQYMFDYHDKLLSSNEKTMALSILEDISTILKQYFHLRKDSSVRVPYGLMISTSDSQSFLTPNFERFLSTGDNYIKDRNNSGLTRTVKIFRDLIVSSSAISYIDEKKTENPISEQSQGYLDMLLRVAIENKNIEALFQISLAYQSIGSNLIDRNLKFQMSAIYKSLFKAGVCAIQIQSDIVLSNVIDAYSIFISKLIDSNYYNLELELKKVMDYVNTLTSMSFKIINITHLANNSLAKPYTVINDLIIRKSIKIEGVKSDQLKNTKESILISADELRRSLRFLSENFKNADHILIETLANILANIGSILIELAERESFKDDKNELLRIAHWYVHQPKWFTHDVKVIDPNLHFDALIEAVAVIGLQAMKFKYEDIVESAINDITAFAIEMLEKEKRPCYGFTTPRIMERACYIGILAKSENNSKIVKLLTANILKFEQAYQKLWFPDGKDDGKASISENQLRDEIIKLREDFSKIAQINRFDIAELVEKSKYMLFNLAKLEDFDDFIEEIWGIKSPKSSN